jgi:glucose-6-phosphate-specific signal transduction histidine kinase
MNESDRFALALGRAAIHVWAELPQEVQEKLFEHAVVAGHRAERDESLREQLAKFLHDRHARTLAGERRREGA